MGKRKQQKQYRINHRPDAASKQQMSSIMKQLAEMKKKQEGRETERPVDLATHKKKIKKEEKLKKVEEKKKKRLEEQGEADDEVEEPQLPKVNIFAVDNYESGVKTVIHNKLPQLQKMDAQGLQNQTSRLMGGDLTFQTFGDKPLKIIEEEDKVALSEDEDQPNSAKNITHPNILLPAGTHHIKRSKQIQEFRSKLPIAMKEQELMETIGQHLVTLVCGETGSGKSTQIGQFLVEKNYHSFGRIGITQPRRLATVALASRVAQETGSKLGELVGYQVRHERVESESTLIKFMTDGILLNEMSSDPMLRGYGVIVVDEAHQRKVNTDILIGLLSRVVLRRYELSQKGEGYPLRLVVMSATMRVQDFQNKALFDYTVPIVNVEARMFPVTVYYEKSTPSDYQKAAVKKCIRIHRKLPPGDVLVFLTGKDQIHEAAQMLQDELSRQGMESQESQEQQEGEQEVVSPQVRPQGYLVHCLYSSLPMKQQREVFAPAPPNCRKFVIATNIAETSVTIPNIRYVVDSGMQKHREHEGVWRWRKGWGSKAMAQQRMGRAGRTTHGYCYRLYSTALYANIMPQYPDPQISLLPIQGVLLQLTAIGIQQVLKFPFPTPPPIDKIKSTLKQLSQLKAIQPAQDQSSYRFQITELGKVLSFLPVDPRLGRMLLMGRRAGVAQHTLLIVILLTVESIFQQQPYKLNSKARTDQDDLKGRYLEQMRNKSRSFKSKYKKYIMEGHFGDIFTALNILGDFFVRLYSEKGQIKQKINKVSQQVQLNQNTMRQVYFNTDQIAQIFETLCGEKLDLREYHQPNCHQIDALLDILLQSYVTNLCRFEQKNKYRNTSDKIVSVHYLSDNYLKTQQFLCCTQFYDNEQGRTYMRYPFQVKNLQLLASYGTVSKPTEFSWRRGTVVGLATGSVFGWEVPGLFVADVPDQTRYLYIAKFFLQGKIVPGVKALSKYLIAPSSTVKVGNLDYKVQKLIQTFKQNKVDSLTRLQETWAKNRWFLKEELRLWVKMNDFDSAYLKIRQSLGQTSSE